ncbi:hypothetical protein dsat_0597 [Alkalidesulfovibrio alkalitolerans DSM 16529]|uniref:Transmembrane protein n=1 Tax=Alkalidesulfovibrio alkalitolerans DSM 16529 TaxID=1121439 RepID=S7T970_9BACT|nr:hypothetical protein [Alkalidesulfovibrio alkalitolerans]EPR33156.1 hypothetical protein dsat_0597 [Alkalidesulfovibrio alkalitolerans DSM 16529]
MSRLVSFLARPFSGRSAIVLFNLAIMAIAFDILWDMVPLVLSAADDIDELERVSDGLGTILIAYGVLAEERESLMKFARLYPAMLSPVQERLDHLSHGYGMCFLVIGLFMEMGVQLVKIPDAILDTQGLEALIFGVNAFFIALTLALMTRFTWRVLRAKAQAPAVAPAEA